MIQNQERSGYQKVYFFECNSNHFAYSNWWELKIEPFRLEMTHKIIKTSH